MRFERTQNAGISHFEALRRHNPALSKTEVPEIGRVRNARDRVHADPCARVNKRTAGGGVTHV